MEEHLLTVGDRVIVYGEFDMDPEWLADSGSGYAGIVVEFIPGQNDELAAVVELDNRACAPRWSWRGEGIQVRGRFLVLDLGHVGTTWATPTPRIHVELCADAPPPVRWQDRPQGAWVESHATYHIAG